MILHIEICGVNGILNIEVGNRGYESDYLFGRCCCLLLKNEKRWWPPLFTKQTTKITLRTLLFTKKPINPKKFKKIRFAKLIVNTLSVPSLLHNWPELTIISTSNFGVSIWIYLLSPDFCFFKSGRKSSFCITSNKDPIQRLIWQGR